MDFDFSDEQRMLVDTASRYVRERCSLEARRADGRTPDGFSRARWADFAEMGWLALPLPESAAGLGGGCVDVALLMEALGRGLVIEPMVDGVVLAGHLLAHESANAEAATPLLAGLVSGESVPVLAHVEGDGRSEFETSVETRAQADSLGWRLQGAKCRVVHGASASHWLVSARLDGAGGFGLLVVPRDAAGVRCTSHELIDGTRAADLAFDGVRLPPQALLLAAGAAAAALDEALDRAIVALGAAAVGSMEAVMAMTADYLKTRVQYGKPLATFQALQHHVADMFIETELARAQLYRALAATEAGEPVARRRAVSGAKWAISRAGLRVAGQGIQLHGGIGMTEEYAVGHHYKGMVSFDKRFGDADFHLVRSSDLFDTEAA